MIQFNLLPDIKMQYIKARRQKRLVMLAATMASIVAASILVLLLAIVYVAQKKNLSDLNSDIKTYSTQLKSTKDLDKILTVQNQLKSLPALHNQKAVAGRLFVYLPQLTPTTASIAKLDVDFAANTISVGGSADALTTVNKFTDTLKFTTYSTKDLQVSGKRAFSDVVLTTFARNDKGATYTIDLKFDPTIFKEDSDVTLTVPNIISTRSEVEQPSALFQQSTGSTKQ
ncbi:MAG TPA: hypothetical protein VMY99_00250 [Nevskiaceae bacterium]|nr:hypothetical protein [Nevskiaceae bacterium]